MKIKGEIIIGAIGFLIVFGVLVTFLFQNFGGKQTLDKPEESTKEDSIKENQEEKGEDDKEDDLESQDMSVVGDGENTGAAVSVSQIVKSEREKDKITLGIDVSKYQGTIDWEKVAQAGIDFAMIRVGYRSMTSGKIIADSNAKYNMQEASKYGIHIGAYFFSSAVSEEEAREEAEWTADYISKYKITYPVAYDCEGYESGNSRQNHMGKTERTNAALAFLKQMEEEGYIPMFYSSKGEMENDSKWETSRIEGLYKTWVAQYPSVPYPQTKESNYNGIHHMWQYTNQGTVDGIDKTVDVNVAYFGFDQAEEAQDKEAPDWVEADAEALMDFEEVDERVTAKDKTNLRDIPSQGADSKIRYTLSNGEIAKRTGVSSSGWSRIVLEGKTYYAVSSYLTTDLDYKTPSAVQEEEDGIATEFKKVNEKVTPKDAVNLRTLPSVTNENSQIVEKVANGEILIRTGINTDVGWSRVEYNGQTLYCVSSYLQIAE